MDAIIHHLENREELPPREVAVAADYLLDESGEVEKKARLLKALADKGETAAEIAEFVAVFLEKAQIPDFIDQSFDGPTIDVCGTGGDKLDLFNVSTTSMFVVAAAGGVVIKHGNRGITSKSGGADVLEALGVGIDLPSAQVGTCLEKAGVGFLFAPQYHPAFKAVVPVRKLLAEQGQRTIFNLIGPLLNPARPECQLVGFLIAPCAPYLRKFCNVWVATALGWSMGRRLMAEWSTRSVLWGRPWFVSLEISRGRWMKSYNLLILVWRSCRQLSFKGVMQQRTQ